LYKNTEGIQYLLIEKDSIDTIKMVPFEINWNLIYGLDENVSNGVNNYIGNKLDSFLSETRDTLKSTLSVFRRTEFSHQSYIKTSVAQY
jgi:hypothetical protein